MRIRSGILMLMVIALLHCFAEKADACSCLGYPTPCEAFQSASAVFIGYVKDVLPAEEDGTGNLPAYRPMLAHLTVEQTFKGITETEIVFPRGFGGDCIPGFDKGERWLIYAVRDRKNGKLYPMGCSRNQLVTDAADDLAYLRLISTSPGTTRISGTIRHYDNIPGSGFNLIKNMAGLRVTLTDHIGKSFVAFTDGEGAYEFLGMPAGKYKIHLEIPADLKLAFSENDIEVELKERSCAGVDFSMRSDGSVSGKVLDSEGRVMPETGVQLVPFEMKDNLGQFGISIWDYTNEEGRFELKEVPPGKYLLGINLDREPSGESPFSRTFYPGVTDLSQAKVIVLSDGESLTEYDLRLPPQLATRVKRGNSTPERVST